MDEQCRDTDKIGQRTKNEDKQNKETQHRKLKQMRVMDCTKKKHKQTPRKRKGFSSVGVSR